MNNKWTLWVGIAVVLIIFVLIWQFAPAIQRWMANVFLEIIALIATFVAGWLVGRYSGKRNKAQEK